MFQYNLQILKKCESNSTYSLSMPSSARHDWVGLIEGLFDRVKALKIANTTSDMTIPP